MESYINYVLYEDTSKIVIRPSKPPNTTLRRAASIRNVAIGIDGVGCHGPSENVETTGAIADGMAHTERNSPECVSRNSEPSRTWASDITLGGTVATWL